jgi:peptide/nickel transport system substrate-binding protein
MMLSEYTKFKLNRRFRKLRRRGQHHTERLETHARVQVVRRWQRLRPVRNFVLSWWAIWLVAVTGVIWQWHLIDSTYRQAAPEDGGTFVEGMVGEITNINPLFAIEGPEAAASRLVFNGLLRYADNGQLVDDLAEVVDVDESGTVYTVRLREGVDWHDGVELTADDVTFTFQSIQHPDTRSPLNASWQDIDVTTIDKYTVEFRLPNPFSPFAHSLTTGIVPKHLLEMVGPGGLRPAEFNQAPVGTGPFRFSRLDGSRSEVTFAANTDYFRGRPKLDRMILRTFDSFEKARAAYEGGILTALADLPFDEREGMEKSERPTLVRNVETPYGVFVFYKNSHSILSDKLVRRALTQAVNPRTLVEVLQLQHGALRGPLLIDHLGYDPALRQPGHSPKAAVQLLKQAGWKRGADGIMTKGGKRLSFDLVSQEGGDYARAAAALQAAWREIGAEVNVRLFPAVELQQSYVKTHNYAALLYGVDLGADPDVFVYWHSSQAKVAGFNFSEYKNRLADDALEGGRTRSSNPLRAAKYKTFMEEWRNDLPATALYTRHFIYAQHTAARTFTASRLIQPADRFNNVETWTVRLERR